MLLEQRLVGLGALLLLPPQVLLLVLLPLKMMM